MCKRWEYWVRFKRLLKKLTFKNAYVFFFLKNIIMPQKQLNSSLSVVITSDYSRIPRKRRGQHSNIKHVICTWRKIPCQLWTDFGAFLLPAIIRGGEEFSSGDIGRIECRIEYRVSASRLVCATYEILTGGRGKGGPGVVFELSRGWLIVIIIIT